MNPRRRGADDLSAAIATVTKGQRLGPYVRAHLAEIKAKFAEGHSWITITEGLTILGVRDRHGVPPKWKTVHQAVQRAEKQRKARRVRTQVSAPAAPRPAASKPAAPRPAEARVKSKHSSDLWDE